jgi:hypothetical protein
MDADAERELCEFIESDEGKRAISMAAHAFIKEQWYKNKSKTLEDLEKETKNGKQIMG